MFKVNKKYIGLFLLVFITEVIIALFIRDRFIRPYVGDMLIVVLLYFFLRIFFDYGHKLLFGVFIFAVLVEISQYFNFYELLGVESRLLKTVLGATFDVADIICYFAGTLLIYLCHSWKHQDQLLKKEKANKRQHCRRH